MKISIIGGGPAGLTFASLMKRADPAHDITVYERGPRGATWGFGVVFSDRALDFLRADDEPLYQMLTPHMETWADLTIVHSDVRIPISGNGFGSIGRLAMLEILYAHAESLGVRLEFDHEIDASLTGFADSDLIVAADGANSAIRQQRAEAFGTSIEMRPNRFIWYGTTMPFETLSLTFRSDPAGVFCAHHYRYAPDMSTFLVEVDAATYAKAGFEAMSPQDTIAYCERVFAKDLQGHPILSNNSYWREFPLIWNERWHDGNIVLMGDALRTAHFSIGSGTRLAMEDAIALYKAFVECGNRDGVRPALERYRELRLPPMKKIWDAANVSLRWYEGMGDMMSLDPYEFAYRYMTRSGRVDHAALKKRDPLLAQAYERLHPEMRF
ncbi:MAG: FAD-dependent monooxygenase [Burkholderiaceae bacterium]